MPFWLNGPNINDLFNSDAKSVTVFYTNASCDQALNDLFNQFSYTYLLRLDEL
jgi:hypothetical protein